MQLSVLAEMLDKDLTRAFEAARESRLSLVDLKGHIYGAKIENLDQSRRERLQADLEQHQIGVYCFASQLGHVNVLETSEASFRQAMQGGLDNIAETLPLVRPQFIRLLACKAIAANGERLSIAALEQQVPWLFPAYRDAIRRIADLGLAVTIENEPDSVLSSPEAVMQFFGRLDGGSTTGFTWDIQNMWQSGTFPTVETYSRMRSVINYVHLKGGRQASASDSALKYRSVLENASWPVRELVAQVIQDGVSPVICLNTSHGEIASDYVFAFLRGNPVLPRIEALKDAAFLRESFGEIA